MGVRFRCRCGQPLEVPTRLAGQPGTCPSCQGIVVVPDLAGGDTPTQTTWAAAPPTAPARPASGVTQAPAPDPPGAPSGPWPPSVSPAPWGDASTVDEDARAAMLLGLASLAGALLCCGVPGLVLGPVSIIKGLDARRLASAQGQPAPAGARAGIALGLVALVISALLILAASVWVVSVAATRPR